MKKYGHIIIGCGAAGLSLAYHLSNAGFPGGPILLIDKEDKVVNDHAWGYWSKNPQPFDAITKRSFKKIGTIIPGQQTIFDLKKYQFHVLQRSDFEEWVKNHLVRFAEVSWLKTDVEQLDETKEGVHVYTSHGTFLADYVFSSLYSEQEIVEQSHLFIRQHIKSWVIETPNGSFDPEIMTLFDFNIPQMGQMSYFTVVPNNEWQATVKLNIFSEKHPDRAQYGDRLQQYVHENLKIHDFTVKTEEWGLIPLTDHYFATRRGNRIIQIGVSGGCTKASSGYSFNRIQRHSAQLVSLLKDGWPPYVDANSAPRFRFYDQIILNVMARNATAGAKIFAELFAKNGPEKVFKFLDEDTLLTEDFKIISTLPSFPFIRSLVTLAGKEVNPLIKVRNVMGSKEVTRHRTDYQD